ncbi:MAG: N-acetylneuraminate synthase family protein [Lachnospiraceae bacterium]|nr:N-acetylneuraminate synthase family protein [Lachnospiraceae bacterium]MDE7435605.1 N-acetylneuraminate synthase family protein [Lachnospiraceae bacterium]
MQLFEKPLFTFEMANNHQGDVEHGKRIIRELKKVTEKYEDVFSFAMKFQYRDLDTFIHPDYKDRMDIKNVKRFQETRLSMDEFLELKQETQAQGMFTMCTAFDEKSVQRISEQGYDIIKIASCSFTDWPLLEEIAGTGLPVIASAAGSSLEDIDKVVSFFRHRHIPLALMHCIAEYPTPDEHLEMNQITLYKKRYPNLRIGFSTHEDPDDLEPVKIAVAKGAEIFEKHVGVATDTITLNGYSATPQQVDRWLDAARKVYRMCGVSGVRYTPLAKEKDDLRQLQRGVFARHSLTPGDSIGKDDIFLAFPSQPGQLLANQLSKYLAIVVRGGQIEENQPILLQDINMADDTQRVQSIVLKIMGLLKKSNVIVPVNSTCQISHHYGLERFEETGAALIDCINREYCKKILIVLPGQAHPVHLHKKKEETFTVLYGTLDIDCNGERRRVEQGESMTVERGVNHSFSSEGGCVFEEISTTHFADDSYYEAENDFVNPRKTTVYLTKEMLENMSL